MKAEHRHELETNTLAEGAANLIDRAKHGQLVSPKTLGLVLGIALVGGVLWYVLSSNRSAASTTWATFADTMRTGGQESLDTFVKANGTDTAGRLARLELARLRLGTDGIAKLPTRDADQRTKAVTNVETARTELRTLADEFRGDKTLEPTCLLAAAEAELALVGIAKTPGGSDYRGNVSEAVSLIRKAADVVGPTSTAGEALVKRANDLEANKAQVEDVGVKLNNMISPTAPSAPVDGLGNPKPPTGPIQNPAPPTAPAGEGPKAPAGPITTPPTAVRPATPPTAAARPAPPATPTTRAR